MFGQRLLRKVGRQFLTSLFISLCTPQLLFPSSPTNCIQSIAQHPIQRDPIGCRAELARFSMCVALVSWVLYVGFYVDRLKASHFLRANLISRLAFEDLDG